MAEPISRPDWGPRTDGPRETPGSVPASPATTKPAEARQPVPAQPSPARAGVDEIDDEEARANAEMLRTGAFTQEELARFRGRPVGELAGKREPTLPAVERELRAIDQRRRSDRVAYDRGPDPARELELLEMRERLKEGRADASAGDGKPSEVAAIDEELAAIQRVMRENRPKYDRELSQRHLELLQAKERLARGPTEDGALAAAMADWSRAGGVDHHLAIAQATAQEVAGQLDEEGLAEFQASFDALPVPIQSAVYSHIGVEAGFARPATDAAVTEFAEIGTECADLVASWGSSAASHLGAAQSRVASILKGLPASERTAALEWMDAMPASQQAACIAALAGKG